MRKFKKTLWLPFVSATLTIVVLCLFVGTHFRNKTAGNDHQDFYVSATVETDPVPTYGDAADDPAVWYNAQNPLLSTIIGTDKDGGIVVYDLLGELIQYLPDGKFNNVDVRYNFPLSGKRIDIVTAGNRGDSTMGIYKISRKSRKLENIVAGPIKTVAPYGSCMYHSQKNDKFYYIVNSKTFIVEQWELFESDIIPGKIDAKLVRTFETESGPEGCVADDELGLLYIGEQERGIWKYDAEPDSGNARTLVDSVSPKGHLTPQVEGLAIYYLPSGKGYLVASSQGTNEFVIYRRQGNNEYVHTFQITNGNGVDEVTHTDGLDVASYNFGPKFPEGFLVVQDHLNDEEYRQNFKIVPWHTISKVVGAENPENKSKLLLKKDGQG